MIKAKPEALNSFAKPIFSTPSSQSPSASSPHARTTAALSEGSGSLPRVSSRSKAMLRILLDGIQPLKFKMLEEIIFQFVRGLTCLRVQLTVFSVRAGVGRVGAQVVAMHQDR